MIDREKVIRGLECCEKANNCGNCPYDGECAKRGFALTRDAIALLREQDAVKPKWFLKDPFFRCGVCDKELPDSQFRFCPWCGRAVKWDD